MKAIVLKNKQTSGLKAKLKKHKSLLWFPLPAIILAIVFSYFPMIGIITAFKDKLNLYSYGPIEAFFKSDWSFRHFQRLFGDPEFYNVLVNTLYISFLKIVILFPLPVILAIMVTEINSKRYSKVAQSLLYLPHFLSWAVISGIFKTVLDPTSGAFNQILMSLKVMSRDNPVYWFGSNSTFRGLIVFMSGWKEIGWSAITYIASIMAIDASLYEAAKIDGAGKFRQIRSITIPSILPVILIMFIIRIGYLMEAGFDQIFTMLNPLVYESGDIIGTYVYRLMKATRQYEFSTAVGLFNSTVALVFILTGNFIVKKLSGKGIW